MDIGKDQYNASFLECPQCHGFGYALTASGEHVTCSMCHNKQSVYGFFQNDVLYWGHEISPAALLEKKMERVVNWFINSVLLIIGIGGFVAMVLQVVELNEAGASFVDFFTHRSSELLIFWLSVLADLFAYYRIERVLEQIPEITEPNHFADEILTDEMNSWEYWSAYDNHKKIDVSHYFKTRALNVLDDAYQLAIKLKHAEVRASHLFLALMEQEAVASMFYRVEINSQDLVAAIQRIADRENQLDQFTHSPDFGAEVRKALMYAYAEARYQEQPAVDLVEVMVGSILADQYIQDALFDRDVDMQKIRNLVHWSNLVTALMDKEHRRKRLSRGKPKTVMNRAMTARPTKNLDAVSQDLTLMAKNNAFMAPIGREKEINEAFRVLQEGHSSVMLVGPSGVGKTTILQGIANLMTSEDVPAQLQDKRLVVTDPGAIIAGASGIGGLEQRMQLIIQDIILAGNVIWAIEDIHTLLGAGSTQSSIDIGKILMNYISQGYIKVLGTTTTPEFQKHIENQETFLRRFQVVQVPELNHQDSIKVLEGRAPYIEAKNQVFFTYDALESAVVLSDRYIQDRHLPAKAVDIIEEAAIYTREHYGVKQLVRKSAVEQIMSEKTNVAVAAISQNEADKLLNMEDLLHRRVIGQHEAINAIGKALRRAREDLRDATRPIASLLFLGPTGVGKTETAKAIAEAYFGNESNMMRFDMSEYQTPASLSKLIGAPGQQGNLTEAIRKTPFGIVLLDEIEKAHSDVINIFLQVMEDGRLTDGTGRTVDFTNAMIVATSNAGTDVIQQLYAKGATSGGIKDQLLNEGLLNQSFRPELLNRFDHVVVFTPLTKEELQQVCELLLAGLAKQMEVKGITLRWTDEAVVDFAERGYDPIYGARPLRRLIQDTAQDAIAKLLLQSRLSRRDVVELQAGGQVEVIKAERI